MIQIRKLTFGYPSSVGLTSRGTNWVFRDASFSFGKGVNYLVKPNGWGKTTLLKILAGLIEEHEGEILIDGRKTSPSERRNLTVFIPSNPYLPPRMKVRHVARAITRRYGTIKTDVLDLLEPLLDRQFITFSSGYRKFVVTLLALSKPVEVVLLDELVGLDEEKQDLILELLEARRFALVSCPASRHTPQDRSGIC